MIEITDVQGWNRKLLNCSDYNFYQSYEWGQVKALEGWRVLRLFHGNENEYAIAQCFIKRIFGVNLIWVPGGPLISNSGNPEPLEKLLRSIEDIFSNKRYIIRHNQQVIRNPIIANLWRKLNYSDPFYKIASNLNVVINFKKIKSLEESSHSKFRYGVRKAKQNSSLKIVVGKDALFQDVLEIYSEMIDSKGLNQYRSREFLDKLFDVMNDSIKIVVVRMDNQPVSGAVLICLGDRIFYFLGASNDLGRKYFASYLMFDYICNMSHEQGLESFNLCGIDPLINYGVYEFKKRTGGDIVEYIGEKEKASSEFVRVLFNVGLWLKSSTL